MIIKRMIRYFSVEVIAKMTGLTVKEVEVLKKKWSTNDET